MTARIIIIGEPADRTDIIAQVIRDNLVAHGAAAEFPMAGSLADVPARQQALRGKRLFIETQQTARPPGPQGGAQLAEPDQPYYGAHTFNPLEPLPSSDQMADFAQRAASDKPKE
jgi:hypothetical protein